MKLTLILGAVALIMLTSAMLTYGDISRPKVSPTKEGRVVFHTSLTVVPDEKFSEARLQISQDTLNHLRAELDRTPANESMIQRLTHSSTRTIIAGLFLFLSVSFAGVWLARSGHRRRHKAVAAALLSTAVLGAAVIITQANAGPPGYVRWGNLPQALSEGRATSGGLDLEIVPEGNGLRLIVPLRAKKPGDE